MRYGLIGNPLGHSWSPRIHALLGDYDYQLYPLEKEQLRSFLAQSDLGGLNVTIPYKKEVIPLCAELSDAAKRIGSVNTLVFKDGQIFGDNTDCDGFLYMLRRAGISLQGKKVVILGSGGTMLTAKYCAEISGAGEIVIISRKGESNYDNISVHRDADILINTTPVGMYPNNGKSPLCIDVFDHLQGVVDVIYNPMRTALVQSAMEKGIPATGGLPMLVAQAVSASSKFFAKQIPDDVTDRVFRQIESEMQNIVLIGMPGSGKTSVGQLLAKKMGRTFIDLDEEIAEANAMSVPDIINTFGEAKFRELESVQAARLGKTNGLVIACGGGTPLRHENMLALSQNGRIYQLLRDRTLLPTDGRPLSVDLEALEQMRMPIYNREADCGIPNHGTIQDTVKRIMEAHTT